MIADPIEEAADRLLEQHGFINHRRGKYNDSDCYTERQLRDHRRHEYTNNDATFTFYSIAGTEFAEMIPAELMKCATLAGLTDDEMDIWKYSIMFGLTLGEIADVMEKEREIIRRRLVRARKRVFNAMILYPWAFWWEVYFQEVHRG